MLKLARISGLFSSLSIVLFSATNVLADESTLSAGLGGGEGTSSSLPDAGTTGLTYILFAAGAMLFIYGMLKLARSYAKE